MSTADSRNGELSTAQRIREVTTPLPGGHAAENRRPLNVPGRCSGMTMLDFLAINYPRIDREVWSRRLADCSIVPAQPANRRTISSSNEKPGPVPANRIVREGECFILLEAACVEPDVSADIRILEEDDELIVISKPAPLPVHPSGRFNRNTLQNILNLVWFPERASIIHRLDANTSGVMVISKCKRMASRIQRQFEQRTVAKSYLARVYGHPEEAVFRCDRRLGQHPDQGGVRLIDPAGDPAVTEFRLVSHRNDGTSLLRAFPQTGRTNQIRAHLWSLGHPIVGDPAYLPGGGLGTNRTLLPSEPPMCLHAESLSFIGAGGTRRSFQDVAPSRWT